MSIYSSLPRRAVRTPREMRVRSSASSWIASCADHAVTEPWLSTSMNGQVPWIQVSPSVKTWHRTGCGRDLTRHPKQTLASRFNCQ